MTRFILEQESYGHGQLGDRTITLLREAGMEVEVETHYPYEPDEYFVECKTADDILNISRIVEDAVRVVWDGDGCTPVLTIENGWRNRE